jgi:hypothetical protein
MDTPPQPVPSAPYRPHPRSASGLGLTSAPVSEFITIARELGAVATGRETGEKSNDRD